MAKHIQTGQKGEALALMYLESHGYTILERNWRFSKAEVDIIAMKNDILVFVEVKARTNSNHGRPEDFVSPNKQLLLLDAAGIYAQQIGHDWAVRFDIISVVGSDNLHEIQHFEDAFYDTL